tara:strand:- start:17890 stop:18765 length:876 start_codon:yes stop_codon:yes gene_type:complete
MKKKSKVSVIINCLNGEKFLDQAIKSVLKQDYTNLEIIFWDNHSSDKSIEQLKKIKINRKIKLYKSSKTIKLYNARNSAIKHATGKYIAFLDVDDTWEKKKISLQVDKIEKDNSDLIYSNHWILNRYNKSLFSIKKLPQGYIAREILLNYPISISTVLLKKRLFKKYGKFNDKYEIIGDFDFFFRLSKKIKISVIQKPLATYRIHSLNTSSIKLKLRFTEMTDWLQKNYKSLKQENYLSYCGNIKQRNKYLELSYYIKNENYKIFFININSVNSLFSKLKLIIKLILKIIL